MDSGERLIRRYLKHIRSNERRDRRQAERRQQPAGLGAVDGIDRRKHCRRTGRDRRRNRKGSE